MKKETDKIANIMYLCNNTTDEEAQLIRDNLKEILKFLREKEKIDSGEVFEEIHQIKPNG